MEKKEYYCTDCGSKNILRNDMYSWDVVSQKWVTDSSIIVCAECGSDLVKCDAVSSIPLDRPIITYGIYIVDVYFSKRFLMDNGYGENVEGLTFVFDKVTLNLLRTYSDALSYDAQRELEARARELLIGENNE